MSYCSNYVIFKNNLRLICCLRRALCSAASPAEKSVAEEEEEFKRLELIRREVPRRKFEKRVNEVLEPRYKKMPVDQDWPSVWPSARSFHPATVPLPLRQGYIEKGVSPSKFANAELMKIPNFLHLTPPAIERHCEALKKFCTPWPEGLKTDEDCRKHFPVEIISTDFCHSSPTIHDPRARIVTLQIKLSSLNLDYHARDKLLRLVGEMYDKQTDILSLVADRCPLKRQNYDYTVYLLTALYYESWKTEPWESEKTEADMEKFFFEGSRSEKKTVQLLHRLTVGDEDTPLNEDETKCRSEIQDYSNALTSLLNEGENEYSIQKYKDAVCHLLNIQQPGDSEELQAESVSSS